MTDIHEQTAAMLVERLADAGLISPAQIEVIAPLLASALAVAAQSSDPFDQSYPCPRCERTGRKGRLHPVLICGDHGSFVPAFSERPPRLTPYERNVLAAARAYREVATEVYALLASGKELAHGVALEARARRADAELPLLIAAITPEEEAADAS